MKRNMIDHTVRVLQNVAAELPANSTRGLLMATAAAIIVNQQHVLTLADVALAEMEKRLNAILEDNPKEQANGSMHN